MTAETRSIEDLARITAEVARWAKSSGSTEKREDRILFLDLETTGLDPDHHQIIEVGAILMGAGLVHEYGRLHFLINPPRPTRMLDTIDMHRASGLYEAVQGGTCTVYAAEESILEYLVQAERVATKTLEIAGFSIHFDRSFLRVHMPRLHGWLSHRMIDVSTIRSLHRRWIGEPRKQAQAHRAIADCEEAIAELRTYRALFEAAPASVPSPAPEGVPTP